MREDGYGAAPAPALASRTAPRGAFSGDKSRGAGNLQGGASASLALRQAVDTRRPVVPRRSHSPHLPSRPRSNTPSPAMPHNDLDSERGVMAWLRRWWRPLVAEVLATALLMLLGIAALLPLPDGTNPPLTHPALAFGLVVLANVEIFGPTSGAHMNPAITLAALLYGKIPVLVAAAYAIAQFFGATIGFGALMLLSPKSFEDVAASVGGTRAGSVSPMAAAGTEALLTGVLVLAVCAAWSAHERVGPDPTVSIKLGLTLAGLIYAGGVMTGASLNPARSFAPALLQTFASDHWVYWVGPLGGAALAAGLHRAVLRPAPALAPRHEDLPLHDKQDH
ncbi:unnamed protein product, partial [Brenthis ino]